MGSGKSTVSRLLAALLGCAAVDTDELVERDKAMTVAEVFAGVGEAAFREAESSAIAGLGQVAGGLVVSVGGGAVKIEANRRAMRAIGPVVWLRAQPATLAHRVGGGEGRPLLAGAGTTVEEQLGRLAAERAPLYEEVANVVVDVDDLSPEEVAELVLAEVTGFAG